MKPSSLLLAVLAISPWLPAQAADAPAAAGAPIVGMFRLVKPDGATLIRQAAVSPGMAMPVLGVSSADAVAAADGRCAFNVKLEEVSQTPHSGTVTRLYSNDKLVANVSKIDLAAHTGKSLLTQPYLNAGENNVKLVFDAESEHPSVAWVHVRVEGDCLSLGAAKPPSSGASTPGSAGQPPVRPGSSDWSRLFGAFGYSNYAVHGLKTAGYARYGALLELNAALTAVVKAGVVERAAYQTLMARWAAINADADFKALMAKVVPGNDHPA